MICSPQHAGNRYQTIPPFLGCSSRARGGGGVLDKTHCRSRVAGGGEHKKNKQKKKTSRFDSTAAYVIAFAIRTFAEKRTRIKHKIVQCKHAHDNEKEKQQILTPPKSKPHHTSVGRSQISTAQTKGKRASVKRNPIETPPAPPPPSPPLNPPSSPPPPLR